MESLGPVTGVEGKLVVNGVFPDSIKGVLVAAFESDVDFKNAAEYLVDYSGVLENGNDSISYFLQLFDGSFTLAPIGLSMDPAFVIANFDSLLQAPILPIIDLIGDDPIKKAELSRVVGVRRESVREVSTIYMEFGP